MQQYLIHAYPINENVTSHVNKLHICRRVNLSIVSICFKFIKFTIEIDLFTDVKIILFYFQRSKQWFTCQPTLARVRHFRTIIHSFKIRDDGN